MNIYKVTQNVNDGYDTYDSFVCYAENEEQAKRIHPSDTWTDGGYYNEEKKEFWTTNVNLTPYQFEDKYGTWTNDLNQIKVELIGSTDEQVEKGVISSSFNAG